MIVVDTSVLLGGTDADDDEHEACSRLLRAHAGALVVPGPVVAETSWMIESLLGPLAESRFVSSVARGEFAVTDLDREGYQRCAELIETYADLGLGLVDASVVAVAERLGLASVATLNHRDFRVVRPRHVDAFELVP